MATTDSTGFSRGDGIIFRELSERGEVSHLKPAVVVEDTAARKVLWTPCGTPVMTGELLDPAAEGPRRWDRGWRLVEAVWRREVLVILEPGRLRATSLVWDEAREFLGWKIGVQCKPRRTRLGYDRRWFWLSVVVAPDGSWRRKNEDEFALYVEQGRITREQGDIVRSQVERIAAEVERGAGPIAAGWERWRPDADFTAPELPPDWGDLSMHADAAASAWADDLLHVA